MDDLTFATMALDEALGARTEVADRLIARAGVHATIAVAKAITDLATALTPQTKTPASAAGTDVVGGYL